MREHTRGNERYFGTKAGDLSLDWGSNGADYKVLDFVYVAGGKMGNLHKVYGRIRRNPDNETYDSYDVKAGRDRVTTQGKGSIASAIRAHVQAVEGKYDPGITTKGKMPPVPDTIRKEISEVLLGAVRNWDFCFGAKWKKKGESEKEGIRDAFIKRVWNSGKFYSDEMTAKAATEAVGLLNVGVGEYGNLYRMWREECRRIEEEEE